MNDPRPRCASVRGDRIRLTDPLHALLPAANILPMLTAPRALPGSAQIAVLAASGPSERARIEEAKSAIERLGHRVTLAENIDERHRGYLAGSDELRADELNRFLRSP